MVGPNWGIMSNPELAFCSNTSLPSLQLLHVRNIVWVIHTFLWVGLCMCVDVCICATIYTCMRNNMFSFQWFLSWLVHKWRGYLLPTWVLKITCRCFNWILQSLSPWWQLKHLVETSASCFLSSSWTTCCCDPYTYKHACICTCATYTHIRNNIQWSPTHKHACMCMCATYIQTCMYMYMCNHTYISNNIQWSLT